MKKMVYTSKIDDEIIFPENNMLALYATPPCWPIKRTGSGKQGKYLYKLLQLRESGKAEGLAACNSQTTSPFGSLNNFYLEILSNFFGSLQKQAVYSGS